MKVAFPDATASNPTWIDLEAWKDRAFRSSAHPDVMRAVRLVALRCRLKLLTWQEVATVLPDDFQQFLAARSNN